MILEIPPLVSHRVANDRRDDFHANGNTEDHRLPIYSIDTHPNGSKFATSGGDGKIRVWSTAGLFSANTIVEAKADFDCEEGKIHTEVMSNGLASSTNSTPEADATLATLASSGGSVNCVRWSNGGELLASASDDGTISLWILKSGPAKKAFGSSDPISKENWSQWMLLQGHTMDVLDLAWSPRDAMLASCSIDGNVHVWRVPERSDPKSDLRRTHVLRPIQTLSGHEHWVKGISWDPVGKYLASAGEDRCVILWRVGGDWGIEARLTEPLERCAVTTFFRRLSWSPDGQSLCITHAKSVNSVPVGIVVQRGKWDDFKTMLVGHSKVLCISRFSPCLYRGKRNKHYSLVALGGLDGLISVWRNDKSISVLVVRKLFEKNPSDIAWGHDGLSLNISSLDGFVAVIRFTEEELGSPVSIEEKKQIFRGLYGKEDALTIPSDAPCIVENTAQLRLEQLARKPLEDECHITKRASPSVRHIHSLNRGGVGDEVITHRPFVPSSSSTKGGRKRIRPVQVNDEGGDDTESARVQGRFMDHSVTTNGVMEEEDGHRHIFRDKRSAAVKQARLGGDVAGGGSLYHPIIHIDMKTDDPGPLVAPKSFVPLTALSEGGGGKDDTTNVERSAVAAPSVIVRHIQSLDGDGEPIEGKVMKNGRRGLENMYDTGNSCLSSSCKLFLECRHFSVGHIQGSSTSVYSKISLLNGGKRVWRDFVAGKTSCCCGNVRMSAVGTTDGSVYVYDRVGIRRAPAIVVGAGAAHLECSQIVGDEAETVEDGAEQQPIFLMCISTDGIVQVWDITNLKLHVRGSLASLILSLRAQPKMNTSTTTTPTIDKTTMTTSSSATTTDVAVVKVVRSGLTPDGSPVVIMGCQGAFGGSLQAFVLHHGLSTWVRVADGRFALSNFHQGLGDVLAGDGPVRMLQASVSGGVKLSASVLSNHLGGDSDTVARQNEALQWCVTRAHVEDTLACSSLLQSDDELKHWLSLYAHHLANCSDPDIPRIRALVDYLSLDSVVVDKENSEDDDQIHGTSRGTETATVGKRWLSKDQDGRKLVRDIVLPAISSNRQLQKLINEIDAEDKVFLSHQQKQKQQQHEGMT